MTFATTLRELRDKATPGKWKLADNAYAEGISVLGGPMLFGRSLHYANALGTWCGTWRKDDADLICFLVNHADDLLALVEAVEVGDREWRWPDKGNFYNVREILSRLNGSTEP